jgi:hypothetical protein
MTAKKTTLTTIDNYPLPLPYKLGRALRYPVADLEVGQSLWYPLSDFRNLQACRATALQTGARHLKQYRKQCPLLPEKKFTIRSFVDGVRLWRLA